MQSMAQINFLPTDKRNVIIYAIVGLLTVKIFLICETVVKFVQEKYSRPVITQTRNCTHAHPPHRQNQEYTRKIYPPGFKMQVQQYNQWRLVMDNYSWPLMEMTRTAYPLYIWKPPTGPPWAGSESAECPGLSQAHSQSSLTLLRTYLSPQQALTYSQQRSFINSSGENTTNLNPTHYLSDQI